MLVGGLGHVLFSIYWECHLRHIFQRGRYTTNQYGYFMVYFGVLLLYTDILYIIFPLCIYIYIIAMRIWWVFHCYFTIVFSLYIYIQGIIVIFPIYICICNSHENVKWVFQGYFTIIVYYRTRCKVRPPPVKCVC